MRKMYTMSRMAAAAGALCLASTMAQASSGTFTCISSFADCSAIPSTTSLTWAYDGATFTITNTGPASVFVADVYFDFKPGPVTPVAFVPGTGVAFETPASPGALPGGNAYIISGTSWDSTWSAKSPSPSNGIGGGESASWTFVAGSNAIQAGIHLQGLGDGKSASLVTVVPEPEAYGLALAGLLVLGLGLRRRA